MNSIGMAVGTRSQSMSTLRKKSLLSQIPALIVGWIIIASTIEESALSTGVLFTAVMLCGAKLIYLVSIRLADPSMEKLIFWYEIKIILVVFFATIVWPPALDLGTESWGFDPIRYYHGAQILVESNFDTGALEGFSINYNGIFYYFAALFYFFGVNTAVPALSNAFVTLLAVLLLVLVGYKIKPEPGSRDWMLGLGMLIPEVFWYDVLSARETLSMSLYFIATLTLTYFMVTQARVLQWALGVLIVGGCLVCLGLVRAFLPLPTLVAIALSFCVVRVGSLTRFFSLLLLAVLIWLTTIIPQLSREIGSVSGDFISEISVGQITTSGVELSANDVRWSERSIGTALMPTNAWEVVLYAPVRIAFYLIAPLPNFPTDFRALMDLNWDAWQFAFVAASALLYAILAPLIFASFINSIAWQKRRDWLCIHIPFWVIFSTIAIGNQIIHERYRVMSAIGLWGCIWLGMYCPPALIKRCYFGWLLVGATGSLFYITFKYL